MAEKEIPEQIKKSINAILELFNSGMLPKAMAKIVFKNTDKPINAWSMSNSLICFFDWIQTKYSTELKALSTPKERGAFLIEHLDEAMDNADYRGFAQWKAVNRSVKKGEAASAYILAPLYKKYKRRYYESTDGKKYLGKEDKAPEGSEEKSEEGRFIYAFRGVPVFMAEQTEGKPIENKPLKLPQLPFMPIAEFLGIKVVPKAFSGNYYGAFSPEAKKIMLCTPDEVTFFHELAHAVDDHLLKVTTGQGLKGGQQTDQEVVAQFSANVIAYIRGYKIEESTAYTKQYLEHYAGEGKAEEAVIKLMSRVENIVDFIMNFKEAKSPNRQVEEKQGEPPSQAETAAETTNTIPENKELSEAPYSAKVKTLIKKAKKKSVDEGKTGAIVGKSSSGEKVVIATFRHENIADPNDDFEFRYADKLGGDPFLSYIRKSGKRTSELTKQDIDRMYKNFIARKE